MKIIQVTNVYQDEVLNIVQECLPKGFCVRVLQNNSVEELERCIVDADYLLASGRIKIDEKVLGKAKKLKMIQRTGVGLDSLNLEDIRKKNIPLYVNQGVNAESVAEHALLMIMASLRKLVQINAKMKSGVWNKQQQGIETKELSGRKVGIIGMGKIGRRLAELLKGFNTGVIYYDKYTLTAEEEQKLEVVNVDIDTLFKTADIITLHCPLTSDTEKIICGETLNQMKEGVIIINTSRGGLICETALIEALENHKVGAVGLDVYEEEPINHKSKLLKMDNVITTPHIGGITYDSFKNMMQMAMNNIKKFDENQLGEIAVSKYL